MEENVHNATHKPVLMREVLHYLNIGAHKVYLDVTFGGGGHTRAILDADPTCKVIAVDWDAQMIERYTPSMKERYGDRITFLWGNFAHLYKLLKKAHIKQVDGILADFGMSQIQIAERSGISFLRDTELDMRLSPAHQKITASHVVNYATEKELVIIFKKFGEEPFALRIARAIVEQRTQQKITTTKMLANLVDKVIPGSAKRRGIHPATRVFQALRIYVNKELDNIQAFLPEALRVLAPEARLVCISFHSLEDRMVKQFFKEQEQLGQGTVVTPKVVKAQEDELKENISSRSACLRVFEKGLL